MNAYEVHRRVAELVDVREKAWWESKKFWVWFVSFSVFSSLVLVGLIREAHPTVMKWGFICMAFVSAVGIGGQAMVDSVVRGLKVWRGLGPGAFADPEYEDREVGMHLPRLQQEPDYGYARSREGRPSPYDESPPPLPVQTDDIQDFGSPSGSVRR